MDEEDNLQLLNNDIVDQRIQRVERQYNSIKFYLENTVLEIVFNPDDCQLCVIFDDEDEESSYCDYMNPTNDYGQMITRYYEDDNVIWSTLPPDEIDYMTEGSTTLIEDVSTLIDNSIQIEILPNSISLISQDIILTLTSETIIYLNVISND